jgi:6-phosphogluconolactonase
MSLTFKQVTSADSVAAYLAGIIGGKLRQGKKVVWLIPGGSAIGVAAAACRQLQGAPLENLTVTLTDERYGEVNHPDSNWRQLYAAGFVLHGATLVPVLHGSDITATAKQFGTTLKEMFDAADYRIGLFGIGADGHTAGILPHTRAVSETELAHGYDAGTFQRVTMTGPAIARLNEAVVYATGEAKWPVLDQLETNLLPDDQPAQFLKQVPIVTIFNDHKGETA